MRKNRFFSTYILLILVIFFTSSNLLSESKSKKKKEFALNFAIAAQYDNNILRYSDKYIDQFLNEENNGRFHINTFDDLILPISGKISYEKRLKKGFISNFSSEVSGKFYTQNYIKNWYSFQISWRQTIYSNTEFHLYYDFIPHFYARHYRDSDWLEEVGYTAESFKPFEFEKEGYNFWIQQKIIKSTKVRAYFSLSNYFYNKHFIEYDSKNLMLGFRIYHNLAEMISLNGGYKYTKSEAKGFDENGESKDNSDDVNPSYNEHSFFSALELKLPKFNQLKNEIKIDFQFDRKLFVSDNIPELDPLHSGRIDNNYSFGLEYLLHPNSKTSLSIFAEYTTNKAKSEYELNTNEIAEEKDFSQLLAGLRFNYKIEF